MEHDDFETLKTKIAKYLLKGNITAAEELYHTAVNADTLTEDQTVALEDIFIELGVS